jgi:hypothetical protein
MNRRYQVLLLARTGTPVSCHTKLFLCGKDCRSADEVWKSTQYSGLVQSVATLAPDIFKNRQL